ncbi:aminoglycoside phosphotransferase family protein [Hydrogenoanaerobacterium sp.]|uniref:phosphotransferase enzyme family protein n=1 Tax=Hydrogenoanaerobacterium sp. TaxID=2953763 RepID=UPI00289E21ED|nr:aminoglycoside phosphotransferase family protein [Hydrogenoanaerobacterium sp.]
MKPITEELLRRVVDCFEYEGEFAGALPYGSGHINDTFAAYFQLEDGTSRRYILQRVNSHVFKDPKAVMENVAGVTHYLSKAIAKAGGDPMRETLNLIATKGGEFYHVDEDGGFWRMYVFIEDTTTFQMVQNADDFYNSARAFGKFQLLLAEYPAATLHETIPLFHNTVDRIRQFKEALAANTTGRADDVREEIEFVLSREADTHALLDQLAEGKLPLRVTHNDTKLNNVLIDNATGKGICIIDLDTVMPGLSLYDFGDSIRFGATTAAEDERDLSKVNFDISLFEVYTKGYLEVAGSVLTPNEIANLPMGAKLMTLECGMRFLADHIAGDTYFKIHREGHNLDRARTQFKLVADMEQQWEAMHAVVKKYTK